MGAAAGGVRAAKGPAGWVLSGAVPGAWVAFQGEALGDRRGDMTDPTAARVLKKPHLSHISSSSSSKNDISGRSNRSVTSLS